MVSLADAHDAPVRPLLGRRGKEWVGYVILAYFWSNELGGRLAYLDELFVRPDLRGQGIGSALVRRSVKRGKPRQALLRARGPIVCLARTGDPVLGSRELHERHEVASWPAAIDSPMGTLAQLTVLGS